MPRLSAVPGLLLAVVMIVAAGASAARAEEDHTRGVRILDNAGTKPSEPAESAPPVVTPGTPSITSPEPIAPAPTVAAPVPAVTAPSVATTELPSMTALPTIVTAPRMQLPVGPLKAENSAGLAISIAQGDHLHIGDKINLRVSTRHSGYLVIFDIDSTGKATQIYPNVRSLLTTPRDRDTANLIKPGRPVRIPDPLNLFAGFELVASPPKGVAMVLAMLSDRPVQMVDLPDVPTGLVGRTEALGFLQDVARKLRIAAVQEVGGLQPARWSFDAKFYVIR